MEEKLRKKRLEDSFSKITTEEGASVLVYNLNKSEDELLLKLQLTNSEKIRLSEMVSPKRRIEFLGVRLALQKLLGKTSVIQYDNSGKPFLEKEEFKISISHSKNWFAIIAHPILNVGIDIECRTDKIQKLHKRFLSDTEQKEIYISEKSEILELAWSAKETLFKIIGQNSVDFSKQLRIFPFIPKTEGEFQAEHTETGKRYRLSYSQNEIYSLVYCISD